ncbi:MAG: FAD-dependent oxidoreductase [Clostridia bacterium]|nr:FAD-dependent oxidoreductase [Clostridia bacterium]
MKVVIIGGGSGGASAAARIRRLDAQAEIVMLDKGEHVSYSSCALPYYIGGDIEASEDLILVTPELFLKRYRIDARVNSEAVGIDRQGKRVTVRETKTGRTYEESYDKLLLATGAKPVIPKSIKGIDSPKVFTVRNVTDIRKLKAFADSKEVKSIAVIGGGFIGIEIAENFKKAGKEVSLIEATGQILAPYDYDMVQQLQKELMDNNVRLYVSSKAMEITDSGVIVERKNSAFHVAADLVVLAAGVAPDTALAAQCGLELTENRSIRIDSTCRSSDPDIYAVGDATATYLLLERGFGNIALAGPSQKQARVAADNIAGLNSVDRGHIVSSCIRVFGLNAACTGMNEKTLERLKIPYDFAFVLPPDKVGIMPESHYMAFKLLFEVPSGRILGAQAIGKGEVVRRIDVIAAMLRLNGTLDDLKELDLSYSPVFGTAKDVVNIAALVGLNLLHGRIAQVHVSAVRKLAESGAFILDVREPGEYRRGHIKNAVNIPLSQLKERMDEIPKERPVYLHCRTSQRSYYAICELQGRGYRNVWNISGSFLGLSLFEYFNDIDGEREPIVTAYNFD